MQFTKGCCLLLSLLLLASCSQPVINVSQEHRVIRKEKVTELLKRADALLAGGGLAAFKSAEAAVRLAYDIDETDPRTSDYLGVLAFRRGEITLAKSYFRQAIQNDEAYSSAYFNLAFLAEDEGDIEGAIELLDLAIAVDPLNFKARNNLALIYETLAAASIDGSGSTELKEQALSLRLQGLHSSLGEKKELGDR